MNRTTVAVFAVLSVITFLSQEVLAMDSEKMTFRLWTGAEIPSEVGQIPFVEGIEHRTIHAATADGYKFLHGAAIINHNGTFFASWANSPKDENLARETQQGRRAKDPLGEWSAVEMIAPGFGGPERHSHGVFLEHEGELWSFAARFGVGAQGRKFTGLKAEAFVLDEKSDKWQSRGIVMDNCWPYDEPVRMDNGDYITGGQDKDGLPVVAISRGDDLTTWQSILIPYPPELEPGFAETTVWAEGKKVLAVIRGSGDVAWVSTSEDCGRTWKRAMPSNYPMPRSKAYLGKLSTGQLYLLANLRNRDTLVISVGRPGEMTLSSMWRIRHGRSVPPRFPGRAKSKQWSYPYGYEHDGKLYVVYSIGKEDCGLSVIPIESLAVETKMDIDALIRHRPFKYADIFTHPPLPGAAFEGGNIKKGIPDEIARVCKNESNCTVFLSDGTWVTTWGQGYAETHPEERVVCALSEDMGQTWSEPKTIVQSAPAEEERAAYGIPFVVPETDRIYLFYFVTALTEGKVWAREGRVAPDQRRFPEQWSGGLYFVYSDDRCETWSERREIVLPPRDSNTFPDRWHGWVNHPAQVMPSGEVIFTFGSHSMNQMNRRAWQLSTAEASVVRCDNILTEQNPDQLTFTLLPKGPRGIRTDPDVARNRPALQRLAEYYNGDPNLMAHNFQEMTVVALSDGRWVGVGRSFLGSPAFTVSSDRGQTWSLGQPLCYGPGDEPIPHPMTMCPIAPLGDGRYVLLFTNNDGAQRGANHVWDGDGRTHNPQWFTVAREIEGEERNGGLVFGEPRVLVDVDDSGEVNLKTGISMPQFFTKEGRFFVAYNINKEHILLDEIPVDVLDEMTPSTD